MDYSKSFGDKEPIKEHLVRYREGGGGVGQEVADLRRDVNEAFVTLEAGTDMPRITWIQTDQEAFNSEGGTLYIKGTDLLAGQTFDNYTHGTGNAELMFEAMRPGNSGISVEIVDTGALSVAYAGGKLTVNINAGATTANDVAGAVNAIDAASYQIIRCVAGGTGAGNPAALTETELTGGGSESPTGFYAYLCGQSLPPYHEASTTPAAPLTATECKVVVPDLTALSTARRVDDPLALHVVARGVSSNTLTFDIDDLRYETSKNFWVDASVSSYNTHGGDVTIKGEDILQAQAFDDYQHADAGVTYDMSFTAMKPGVSGLSVELVDDGTGAAGNPSVSYAASTVTVNYDGPANGDAHDADDIATAINAAGSAAKGIMRANVDTNGSVPALTSTALTGGSGEGFYCYVSGVEALPSHATGTAPAATVADTEVTVTIPDLTTETDAREANDLIVFRLISDGKLIGEFSSRICDLQGAEARPIVDYLDQNAGAAVAAAGGDVEVVGRNFLQGQTFDSYTLSHDANNSMDIVALSPGVTGYTVEVVDSGGGGLAVTFAAGALEINLGGVASDYNAVATAINANGAATDGYIRANVTAQDGSDVVVTAETPMTGGTGTGFTMYVGGVAALPQNEVGNTSTAKVTDTALSMTTGAVGNANDECSLYVVSNGVVSEVNITVVLT